MQPETESSGAGTDEVPSGMRSASEPGERLGAGSDAPGGVAEPAAAAPGATNERPALELAFRPRSLWQRVFSRVFVLNLVVVVFSASIGIGRVPTLRQLLPLGVLLVLIVLGWLGFCWVRLRHGPPASTVQFFSDHVLAPATAASDNVHRMNYADLLSLALRGGPNAELWFGTDRHLARYFEKEWQAPASHAVFIAEARRQVLALPDGVARLARLDRRSAIAHDAWRRSPRVTLALIASLGAVWVWFRLSGGNDDPFGLVRFGANARALVLQGQLYRLGAANFLHADLVHLTVNCMSLWWLGLMLERLVGPARLISIYFVSALSGSLASTLFANAAFSVGASTAVFGLLGALAVLNLRYAGDLPAGFRVARSAWIATFGLNALLPILVPRIDIAAHLGGLAGGALLAWLMYRRRPLDIERPAGAGTRLGVAVVLALFAACLVRAGLRSRDASFSDALPVARAIADDPATQPGVLNSIAWYFALRPHATADELELAQRAVERALVARPEDVELKDTLATIRYRRNDFDEAVALERGAIQHATQKAFFYPQLARFLAARVRALGPLERGRRAHAGGLQARIAGDASSPRRLQVDIAGGYPEGAEAWLLDLADGPLRGYCRLQLAPGTGAGRLELPLSGPSDAGAGFWSAGRPLSVALVDTTSCGSCEPHLPPRCEATDEKIPP